MLQTLYRSPLFHESHMILNKTSYHLDKNTVEISSVSETVCQTSYPTRSTVASVMCEARSVAAYVQFLSPRALHLAPEE